MNSSSPYLKSAMVVLACAWVGACTTLPFNPRGENRAWETDSDLSENVPDIELDPAGEWPNQVDVELQFLAVDSEEIERLVKEKGGVDVESLQALWRAGKGSLVYAPKIVTHAGCEATLKQVTEIVYPTAFEVQSVTETNRVPANPMARLVSGCVEPSAFETREVGQLVTLIPELSVDGRWITLQLNYEVVKDPVWKDFGSTLQARDGSRLEARMEQPIFKTYRISTAITVVPGVPTLIAGGTGENENGKRMYGIVTAQRMLPPASRTGKPGNHP